MKPASPAPGWCVLYPLLAERARSVGYALAVHGTMGRDLDLVAIPWTIGVADPDTLLEELCRGLSLQVTGKPERKPHGRIAYTLASWTGPHSIDLSVMPLVHPVHTCEDRPYCDACDASPPKMYDAPERSLLDPVGGVCWMIERNHRQCEPEPVWWTGSGWSRNAAKGIRFASKRAATDYAASCVHISGIEGVPCRLWEVTEHIFVDRPGPNNRPA